MLKKALLVALVVVIVVTGLPILVGMGGMPACHDCGPAVVGPACAAAVLAFSGLFIAALISLIRPRRQLWLSLVVAQALERPPQLI